MKFFIVCAIVSVLGFFPSMLFAIEIVDNDIFVYTVLISSIFTFVYSIIAIIVISVKKKDCPNAGEIKAFEKKAISVFLIILAYILAYGLAVTFISTGGGIILLLILVSLIAIPFIIHKRYKSKEKNEANNVLEQLSNNYWEDNK